MLSELIASVSATKWTCAPTSRSLWAYQPERILRHPEAMTGPSQEHVREQAAPHAHPNWSTMIELEENKETEDLDCSQGHSLFQELFFFCTVKNVGDVPGPGCIYVE